MLELAKEQAIKPAYLTNSERLFRSEERAVYRSRQYDEAILRKQVQQVCNKFYEQKIQMLSDEFQKKQVSYKVSLLSHFRFYC